MSTPTGALFYEKRGFKAIQSFSEDDSKWGGNQPYVTVFLARDVE
jgi:hypothetical protein